MAMHTCQIGLTDTATPCPGSPHRACVRELLISSNNNNNNNNNRNNTNNNNSKTGILALLSAGKKLSY